MILVTGSNNHVGRYLVDELVARGQSVRAAWHSRRPERSDVETICIDAESGEGLAEAFTGVSRLFLLTGNLADQVGAEARLVDAAVAAGIGRIVYLSILAAATEAFPFARIHRATERRIESTGIPHVFLRCGGFMQNFITYYGDSVRHADNFALPCGNAREAHVDARDIARVAAKVLADEEHSNRALDITGPEALSYHAIAGILTSTTGRPIQYIDLSEDEFASTMAEYGMPQEYVNTLVEMFRYHRNLPEPIISRDVELVTGSPATRFEDFARQHVQCWAK